MSDDNDLSDRYSEICGELNGNTLENEWEENPNPPPTYGQPDPRTIIEEVAEYHWVWHTQLPKAKIRFGGGAVEIKR